MSRLAETARGTLLVVDDEGDIREFVTTVARRTGSWKEVIEAANAVEAERLVAEHAPDAVLTDVRMPGPSGLDLLVAVRSAGHEPRTAVMTGFQDDPALDARMASIGVLDVLRKPFNIAELRRVLGMLATR